MASRGLRKFKFERRVGRTVVNPLVAAMDRIGVRSALVVELETTGAKSGQPRRVPLTGRADDKGVWVISQHGRRAGWAHNIAAHPKVRKVYYPGLPSHPQHELATRQMRGFGGMIAFDLGSLEAARRLLNGVRLMALAESLGGVETLVSHPATMTHASVPGERRAALGITDGLVRISAGVEDLEDLKEDIAQALARVP